MLGEEQSEARAALKEALRKARAEGPNCSTPQDRMAEASARVTRLEAALQLLGEDSLVAAPLKVALEQARGQARLRPVGERLDSCLHFIERVKKQIAKAQGQRTTSSVRQDVPGGEVGGRIAESGGLEGRGQCSAPASSCRGDGGGGPGRVDLSVEGPSGESSRREGGRLRRKSPEDLVPLIGEGRSTNRSA